MQPEAFRGKPFLPAVEASAGGRPRSCLSIATVGSTAAGNCCQLPYKLVHVLGVARDHATALGEGSYAELRIADRVGVPQADEGVWQHAAKRVRYLEVLVDCH